MAKQSKEALVEDLVDEINESTQKATQVKNKNTSTQTQSVFNFSDRSPPNEEESEVELEIEERSVKEPSKQLKSQKVKDFASEIYQEEQPDKLDLNEEELVKAYEETLATEMLQAAELEKKKKELKDAIDHTEKVDLDLYNVSIPYSNPMQSHSPTHTQLADAESLRIAQNKIKDLHKENERLTIENEELASAAETFRNKVDLLEAQVQNYKIKYQDLTDSVEGEKNILLRSMSEKDKELQRFRQKTEELEMRLQSGLRKIKMRERELENRLELIKLESKAVVNSKDEMILSLKRQLDKVSQEMESLRNKIQESNKYIQQKQEVLRKTVKTLRLALSLLEAEDVNNVISTMKKAE